MTRLRRARLAGALVALGMVVLPLKSLQGSSFSELFVPYRSSRPHSPIRSQDTEPGAQIEGEEVRRIGTKNKWKPEKLMKEEA